MYKKQTNLTFLPHQVLLGILLTSGMIMLMGCANVEQKIAYQFDSPAQAFTQPADNRPQPQKQPPQDIVQQPPEPVQTKDLLPSTILTLDQARSIAVRSNPDVHAAHARLAAATARLDEARSRFLPSIVITHTSARTFQTPVSRNRLNTLLQPSLAVPSELEPNSFAVTTLLNAIRRPLFGIGKLVGNTSPFSEHSSAITISWTLFDGWIRDAQVLAAEHLNFASSHSQIDVERLIVKAVDIAYYQVQLAQEQLRIAQADEVFSQEQWEETSKLQKAGRATKTDVGNFRVRVLAAQANVIASTGNRDTGRVILAELMGLDAATMPDHLDLSLLMNETEEEMAVPDVDQWLARAVSNRPDLQQVREILQSEKANVLAAKGLYYPIISLNGSWGFDRSETVNYSDDDQSSAGTIDMRWELYTGGRRRAQVMAAKSLLEEATANARRIKLSIQSEVRSAVISLGDAQEQIRLQRENLLTARENRRSVQAAYVAGKETLTRLNEAHRDFIAAEANLALARIRLRQAWSDLYAAASVYHENLDHEK